MKLYHGTSEAVARAVLQHGLKPRSVSGHEGNWDHTIPSDPSRVYLTECYAPYFSMTALNARLDGLDDPEHHRGAIIEVDTSLLDADRMLPDEDFLEQAIRSREEDQAMLGISRLSMKERTAWFRDNVWSFQHLWRDSIASLGNASYAGTVPTSAITRVWAWNPNATDLSMMALDPSITLLNHALCANKYKALTRCLMGEQVDAADLLIAPTGHSTDRLQHSLDTCKEVALERLL